MDFLKEIGGTQNSTASVNEALASVVSIKTDTAWGAGVIYSLDKNTGDALIVTNYHVIESAANDPSVTIQVSFADGKKYDAKLVGEVGQNVLHIIDGQGEAQALGVDAGGGLGVLGGGDADNVAVAVKQARRTTTWPC